jgi:hypothetical protein
MFDHIRQLFTLWLRDLTAPPSEDWLLRDPPA